MTTQRSIAPSEALRRLFALLALSLPLYAACTENPVVCAGVGIQGIRLNVVDSISNTDLNPIARATVRTIVGRIDSTYGTVSEAVAITFDVPASYSVSVSAPGYVAQSREITVPRIGNGCIQITTQQATFKLVRAIPFMSTVGR